MRKKIAVIGAGSIEFGTVILNDVYLSEILATFKIDLILMDINTDNLNRILAHSSYLAGKLNRKNILVSATTDLKEALTGAHFVITAIEVNRYHFWSMDFHIPRKYGFRQIYGENGGPGALFHALRNFTPMLHIARTMEELCPEALLLNFANPEQKLCEMINRMTRIKVIGLCHGVYYGVDQVLAMLDLKYEDIEFQACGLNHISFLTKLRNKQTGKDLYPQIQQVDWAADPLADWHEIALGRTLFRIFGLWPSPATNHYGEYINWAHEFISTEMQYFYDPLKGDPWETGETPEFYYTIDALDVKNRPMKPRTTVHTVITETGKLSKSRELAVPIIEGMLTGSEVFIPAIIVPNKDYMPQIPNGCTVEVTARLVKGEIIPFCFDPLPEGIFALLQRQSSINKLLVDSFEEKSKMKLLQTILIDPVVDSYKNALFMMEEMIARQKEILPELN